MSEESKVVARRSWELVNQRNFDALDEVYAADAAIHEPDRDFPSIEEAKQYIGTYFDAFPDLHFSVEDVLAAGDQAVSRWRLSGTHQGESPSTASRTAR